MSNKHFLTISFFLLLFLIWISYNLVHVNKSADVPDVTCTMQTDEQERRKELVKEVCKKYRDRNKFHILLHLEKFYVDDQLKFLYCHMPKTASTTWLTFLLKTRNPSEMDRPHVRSHYFSLKHYNTSEIHYRLKNYFKFFFVRNPLERLISAYRERVENKTKFLAIIQKYAYRSFLENLTKSQEKVSFSDFIRYLNVMKIKGRSRDVGMWSNMATVCQPCDIQYDFIGHYESLATDSKYLLSKLGLNNSSVQFPNITLSTTTRLVPYFYQQLTKKQQEMINERLRIDSEMFGYK